MKKNQPGRDGIAEKSSGRNAVTRERVHARAREITLIAGRSSSQTSQSDYEQAKREVTGEVDMDRQDAILDAIPEEKRWDPVPGSAGQQIPEPPGEDEDSEGRNQTEQLVADGAEQAKREQMEQAAPATKKRGGRKL